MQTKAAVPQCSVLLLLLLYCFVSKCKVHCPTYLQDHIKMLCPIHLQEQIQHADSSISNTRSSCFGRSGTSGSTSTSTSSNSRSGHGTGVNDTTCSLTLLLNCMQTHHSDSCFLVLSNSCHQELSSPSMHRIAERVAFVTAVAAASALQSSWVQGVWIQARLRCKNKQSGTGLRFEN